MKVAVAVSDAFVGYSTFKKGFVFLHEIVDFGLDELEFCLWNCLVDVFCGLSKVFVPVSLNYFQGTELVYFRACLAFEWNSATIFAISSIVFLSTLFSFKSKVMILS